MTEILIFNPDHQEQIAKVAVELSAALEPVLPRVPWLSNSGQQDAFNKIVRMVSDSTDELNAGNFRDSSISSITFKISSTLSSKLCPLLTISLNFFPCALRFSPIGKEANRSCQR